MDEALSMSSMIFLLEAYPHRAGVETRCITAPSALSRDFWQGALVRKMQPRAIQSFVSRRVQRFQAHSLPARRKRSHGRRGKCEHRNPSRTGLTNLFGAISTAEKANSERSASGCGRALRISIAHPRPGFSSFGKLKLL